MKKPFLYMITILITISFFGCGINRKPIIPSHNISKIPFTLSLKGMPTDNLGDKVEKYENKRKNYFVKIDNVKQLRKIIKESGINTEPFNINYEKSNLNRLGDDYFDKNTLYVVFSFGNGGTYIKIDKIKRKNNKLIISGLNPVFNSDMAIALDCYFVGLSSKYAKGITDVKLDIKLPI